MSNYYRTVPYIDLDLGITAAADSHADKGFECDEYGYTSDEAEEHHNVFPPRPPKGHVRFWSDRFYLNATAEEEQNMKVPCSSSCHCGSGAAPPLFPRNKFLKSLDVKAVIVGTFGWSPTFVADVFPEWLERIPTLVLHGQKGMTSPNFWKDWVEGIEQKRKEKEDELTDHEESDVETGNALQATNSDDSEDGIYETESAEFVRLSDTTLNMAKKFAQSSTFQMNYVRCNWKRTPLPGDSSKYVSRENVANNANASTNGKQQSSERESRKGVHHPKFMLLLETSGNLVVMVSTANLTPTKTVEGTWVQRFRPVRNRSAHMINTANSGVNDFGVVLQDFLSKISDAAVADNPNLVDEFMTQHFPCSLSDLSQRFHFEAAQVHLVPIIPGDYQSPVKTKKDKRQQPSPSRFYYGHQRVRYILQEFARNAPQVNKHKTDNTKSDRLVLQPTSLGGDWTQQSFAALIRGYMGYKHTTTTTRGDENSCDDDDDWVCGQADIVWPSDDMMKRLGATSALDRVRKHGNDLSGIRKGEVITSGGTFIFCSGACRSRHGPGSLHRRNLCGSQDGRRQQAGAKHSLCLSPCRGIQN